MLCEDGVKGDCQKWPGVSCLVVGTESRFSVLVVILDVHEFLKENPQATPSHTEILAWIQARAEGGDAESEMVLGLTMTESFSPPDACRLSDWSKPFVWFRRAAEQGYAPAQTMLGVIYMYGRGGMPKNEAEAVNWLKQASDQNEPSAQVELGLAYECGKGIAKNLEEAARFYRLAIGHADSRARVLLKGLDPSSDAKSHLRPDAICVDR